MGQEPLESYFSDNGWKIKYQEDRPPREGKYFPTDALKIGTMARKALNSVGNRVYQHQYVAIERYCEGRNVAVTTPTASGKTLIFNICALQELAANPNARIAAIYPLKALANEQESRWSALVEDTPFAGKVGRIDGGVASSDRLRILKESRIVVLTPDIIHAWMLSSIARPEVLNFLQNLTLVVIDEAHTYSGVFGSNSAFLFRRLIHSARKLGGNLRFIASSATMQDAESHLNKLTGETFSVVDSESDTSPRSSLRILMVEPPKDKDQLRSISEFVTYSATNTDHQSITFVDSRKQTEYLATIIGRQAHQGVEDQDGIDYDLLKELQIHPYRSGYEEADRQRIQKQLSTGKLRGVISTSALEMGIDLPLLTLGVLVGIPRSATSLYQRIGRVGRRKSGVVVIINNGSVVSESVFRDPTRIWNLPFAQSALYLHNQRIQYIHAMCLARQGGENESVCICRKLTEEKFTSPQDLPIDFADLCEAERIGEISLELQAMKAQAGDDPHHTFPLRDLDMQFKVEFRQGPNLFHLGSLSYAQVMREAYPGAVYYYQTQPYRVVRVRKQQRVIDVRPEKHYFTTPAALPTLILPNLTGDNLYQACRYGDLMVFECAMQVGEVVVGFKERRGNNELNSSYPLDPSTGIFYDAPKFTRYAFTSGVVLTHPALNKEHVKASLIAQIIDESFLMSLPFERQDVSAAADKHRTARDGIEAGDRFVCVYDQTYGSLRLTSHMMNEATLRDVFTKARDIALNDINFNLPPETLAALIEMVDSVLLPREDICGEGPSGFNDASYVAVISPGSIGINTYKDNEEFEVEAVFFSPLLGKVAYRGHHVSEKKKDQRVNKFHSANTVIVQADHIHPLDGESKMSYFSLETGELINQLPLPGEF